MESLLMPHNVRAYNELDLTAPCLLQAATGTGKSYIAAEYIRSHGGRWLVLTPRNALEDMWDGLKEKYGLSLDTLTYQALSRKDSDGLSALISRYGGFVFDEAHHVAAESWRNSCTVLLSSGKPVLGLSANPRRYSDGVDVAEGYFTNCVHGISLGDGIGSGILPTFRYVKAMFNVPQYSADGLRSGHLEEFSRLVSKLEYTVENQHSIRKILKKHLGGAPHKIIVFVENIDDLPEARQCLDGIADRTYMMYHSWGKARNAENLRGFMAHAGTAALVNVNMVTEGLHIDGADVLVMLRRTESPSVFFQQLGRIVSATALGRDLLAFDFVGNYRSVRDRDGTTSDAIAALNREIHDPGRQVIVTDYCQDALGIIREIESVLGMGWLGREDDVLRQYYPSEGRAVSRRLPGRTPGACKVRAAKLGLKVDSHAWTDAENGILRGYYPKEGQAVSARLPGRTPQACKAQAVKLGIRSGRRWSEEELATIREYYPKEGRAVSRRLPGRTPVQCTAQANRMGLTYRKWSAEDEAVLREKYPEVGNRITEYLPHHSLSACRSHASDLGLKYGNYGWTEGQLETLRREYPGKGAKGCAELTGKTVSNCRMTASKLGLRYTAGLWTEGQENVLRRVYPDGGAEACARILGKDASACACKARKLGLRRNRNAWTDERVETLRREYATAGVSGCAALTGMCASACRKKARELGLH